ncbi:hypothetical protein DUD43_06970 [Alcaligenes faecalis]|nr:hypothetical protein DUD43_06970 [Alcaligenes faecalis]
MCLRPATQAIDNPHYPEVIFPALTARRMGLISHCRDQKKRRKGLGSVGDTPPFTFFFLHMSAFFVGRARLVFVRRRLLIQVVRDTLPPWGLDLSITDS